MIKTFRKGGIHPPEEKLTSDCPVKRIPIGKEVSLFLSQCIGAPSVAEVKAGDEVKENQVIAKAGGFVGAPIHSPVSGKVKAIEKRRNQQGLWQDAVIIIPDENQSEDNIPYEKQDVDSLSPKEIIDKIGEAGIVGLGGAAFPTRVKLTIPEGKKAEFIIINGAECEPYLTCDDILMQDHAPEIVAGVALLLKAVSANKAIIGIEDNKPEAIKKMKEAVASYADISVIALKKKYPQGSEKQLIYALTEREVPCGGLPIDVGCVVDNVATVYAVYEAVYYNKPLTERIVTVTGKNFENRGNFLIKNGTSLSHIIEYLGGLPEDTGKIIAGGPMMGRAISQLESPTVKGLSGILFMREDESERKRAENCIRCSRCITVCPMGLEPYLFMQQAEVAYWEDMSKHGVMNCLECGCCSYACPSNRPLLDFIRLGKNEIRNMSKK